MIPADFAGVAVREQMTLRSIDGRPVVTRWQPVVAAHAVCLAERGRWMRAQAMTRPGSQERADRYAAYQEWAP